ncbi:MAG: hypothetical protein ACR2MO_12560 [Acidimicrobiales bacterium]
MSTEIVVSVIAAAVALTSAYLSARASQGTARLTHELDLQQSRTTKEQQVEELMSRYREPLLRAAFDLQSRIYNIIKQGFLVRYGRHGRDHEREYALDNTLFLFGEYFSWVEILRRDVQFLDLGDVERNRLLVGCLEKIRHTLADDREIKDPSFRIFRGHQRALGELMISSDDDDGARRQCLGYAQFRAHLRGNASFTEWFRPVADEVSALENNDAPNCQRLTELQHALVDLIDFLDDPPRRFLREHRTKL